MTSNVKWIVFGLCFLAVLAGCAVWYVEAKIKQVTGVVNGAVDTVQETVNAPLKAVSGAGDALNEAWLDFDQAANDFGNKYICPGMYKSRREMLLEGE